MEQSAATLQRTPADWRQDHTLDTVEEAAAALGGLVAVVMGKQAVATGLAVIPHDVSVIWQAIRAVDMEREKVLEVSLSQDMGSLG